MRSISKFSSLLAGLAISSSVAAAQTCLGRPYFSTGPAQVGLTADMGSGIAAYGAEAAAGVNNSFFGSASIAHARYDRGTLTAPQNSKGTRYGATGGYQWSLGGQRRTQFCPLVSGTWGSFNMSSPIALHRSEVSAGGSIGYVHPSNRGVHVVPFAGLAVARITRELRNTNGDQTNIGRDTYLPVTGGVGVHFENSFMLTGQITLPVDLDRADPMLGIRLVVPIGGNRR